MIEVKNLCKTYGRGNTCVHAVRNVSLKLGEGGFLAIMGASGSGKTTLMNILGCLDTPTKGEYYFAGTNVRRLSGESKEHLRSRRIGFIFQSFYLLPTLNGAAEYRASASSIRAYSSQGAARKIRGAA